MSITFQDVLRTAELVVDCVKVHGPERTKSILIFHDALVELVDGEALVQNLARRMRLYARERNLSQLHKDLQAPGTTINLQEWTDENVFLVRAIAGLSTSTVPDDAKRLITELLGVQFEATWAKILEAVLHLSSDGLERFKDVLYEIEQKVQ